MLTIGKIKDDFSLIKSLTGNLESYHNITEFDGHGRFTDIYFEAKSENILQKQVDVFNHFFENYKKYLSDIEAFMKKSYTDYEYTHQSLIKGELRFDVLFVPQNNSEYDLVLVCGRDYKKWILFRKTIDIRVEFQNGKIKSMKRTKDSTIDNEI